ncbi:MAG: hypothetical protein AABY13_00630 [Nanoarchaeota archaeon]
MKRGWGRRGFEIQQRALIWVVQAAGALVIVAALFFYIDDSMQGGLLAKHYYPGNFGQLATVVAGSQDNMIMSDFVSQHGKSVFAFSGQDNVIDVVSNRLPGKSRFWIFTPAGVTMTPFSLSPATGVVDVVKEGKLTRVQ